MIIFAKINQLDSNAASQEDSETQRTEQTVIGTSHVSLSSPLPATTLGDLEVQFSDDSAFHNLRKRLNKRSSSLFKLSTAIRFESTQEVYFHILKLTVTILTIGLIDCPL